MFRRIAATSAASSAAVATRMSSTHTTIGAYGYMIPKNDPHKDVVQKHVPKATLSANSFQTGFMESLEQMSIRASNGTASNAGNGFVIHQHTGCNIVSDNVFNL